MSSANRHELAESEQCDRHEANGHQLWLDWQRGGATAVEDVLAHAGELTPTQLVDVLRAEQHVRCQRGELIGAEEYLQRYAVLKSDTGCAVDIIYSEFLLREQAGEEPRPQEYLRRFPQFAESLARQFKVHGAIGPAHPSAKHTTPSYTPTWHEPERQVAPPSLGPLIRIGRFEIKERLGVGGFGCVYRAHDPQLGRDVALKVAHSHLMTAEYRERFLREARAAGQLQHPNIVAVYDSGVATEGCYIAYQLVSGRSLAQVLKQRRFTTSEAAELVCKLAQAAHHAHMKGVFHRDLKAANVLIDEHGEPYISDFGLARLEGESTLTADAAVLGTPAYMSPEQALGASHLADARSDVYTLGVVLYELLSGRLPFVGSPQSVLLKLTNEEPPHLRSLNQNVPRDLETICLKAMAKRPEQRYPSAQHLADDLACWLRHEPILARPASVPERLWRWCQRNPLVAGLTSMAAVLLLAVGVVSTVAYFVTSAAYTREAEHRRIAVRERDTANQHLYFANMREGEQAWQAASIGRLKELVQLYEPGRNVPDLRGWEWYYLKSHLHRDLFTLRGHEGGVSSVAWSRDGKWLASAGADSTIRIWNATTGRLAQTLHGHKGSVHSVAWSPDGRQLASAGDDKSVMIWDATTGRDLLSLLGHAGGVNAVAWAPQGDRLASAGYDRSVRVWDLVAGVTAHSFEEHEGTVNSVAWSLDGRMLASGSGDGTIIVRDMENWQVLHTLRGHELGVGPVAWSSDGKRLASSGPDQSIKIWDVATGEQVAEMRGHNHGPSCLVWSPDDQRIASTSNDRMVKVWDVNKKLEIQTLRGHDDGVGAVCWSPDGQRLASASGDRTVKVWDLMLARDPMALEGHTKQVRSIAWNPNGREIASASDDGTVRIWETSTGRQLVSLPGLHTQLDSVAWSPDGRLLAASQRNESVHTIESTVRIWKTTTWTELLTIAQPSGIVGTLAWSPDSRRLAGSCSGQTVKVWDAATGAVVCTLQDSPAEASAVAWSPDGMRLAVAFPSAIGLWDAGTGKLDRFLTEKRYGTQRLCWSPDGQWLAAACADEKIRLFNTLNNADPRELSGHTSIIFCVDWHPDGKRLASASYDNAVKIWDATSGQETLTLDAHRSTVWCVAWSPDGTRLASSSYDKTIRIYDATIGYQLGQ